MLFRHPGFNLYYNWMVLLIIIAFAISCIIWAVDIRTEKREASAAATALAEYQAEEQAKAEERAAELAAAQMSEEAILDRWAEAGAKMLYGIRNFKEKYNYSDSDYQTYLQCVWNRYLFGNKITDIVTIISGKDQFTGFYETNPVLDELFKFSRDFFEEKLHETKLSCDPSYRYAELMPDGIFLINDVGVNGYVRRYHA